MRGEDPLLQICGLSTSANRTLWEGERPRCPIRRRAGNEDVAHPVWLNPTQSSLQMMWLNPARSSQSQFQETIVPRVARVTLVPLRYRQSAKHKGPRSPQGFLLSLLGDLEVWRVFDFVAE